ncbi:hypothetical protein LTR74_018766, partial [Friedmanniomyces endolithicus]
VDDYGHPPEERVRGWASVRVFEGEKEEFIRRRRLGGASREGKGGVQTKVIDEIAAFAARLHAESMQAAVFAAVARPMEDQEVQKGVPDSDGLFSTLEEAWLGPSVEGRNHTILVGRHGR